MDKKYIAYGLVFLNAIIQLASCFWYSDLPGFVWTLADSIVILVPLVFGLRMGLLNLLPVAVSEFVWFFKLGVPGRCSIWRHLPSLSSLWQRHIEDLQRCRGRREQF